MLRRTLPFFVLAGFGLLGFHSAYADVPAQRPAVRPPPIDKWRPPVQAQFQAELISETGTNLPTFFHNGRKYVLGSMGQRYKIRVTNPTAQRVEAVVSVDGLDAVDGLTANTSKRGYVVPAFGSVTIDGFRTSMSAVAAFRFSSVSDSFAGRLGQDRNVGVVGVAIFKEKAPIEIVTPRPVPLPRPRPHDKKRNASAGSDSAPSAAPRSERPGLGTQFGEQHESRVRQTTFIRETEQPSQVLEMRYNDRDGLRALGIAVPQEPQVIEEDDLSQRESADPFPGGRRFAQPPP